MAHAGVSYVVTDLGLRIGYPGNIGQPSSINYAGQVAGDNLMSGTAYVWDGAEAHDLGSLGSMSSHATDINDSCQVVGWSADASLHNHAFVWDPALGMRDLGTLGGTWSYGRGINNSGEVVGWSYTAVGTDRAFLWRNGVMTNLGTLGGDWSQARAINDYRQIVGGAVTSVGEGRAFLWQNGVMLDLGTPGGSGSYSSPTGINNRGQVIGSWGPNNRAFFWDDGVMLDIGNLGGSINTFALGINDLGQVVGSSEAPVPGWPARAYHAFLWERGTGMLDLNDLIAPNSEWVLGEAVATNNRGQIVGTGTYRGGGGVFLLTPVPEPSSLLALLCGLGGFGGMMWRRKATRWPERAH
jgi:probable HAF family extracellular repeat protein